MISSVFYWINVLLITVSTLIVINKLKVDLAPQVVNSAIVVIYRIRYEELEGFQKIFAALLALDKTVRC